jgi:hypothetical protein
VLLALLLALAAVLRLLFFDLMEFKGDEVAALRMARRWGEIGQVPRFGLMSGVGIRNPPGFMYVLAPLTALTDSPVAAGVAIALATLVALPLLWYAGRVVGAPRAGLFAAATMAAHPWLILYSRKIWAQSLLPLYVSALLLALALAVRDRPSRAVFWIPPLAVLAWLTHYSAYGLAIVAAAGFAAAALRRRLHGRAAWAGVGVALILLAPYAAHLVAGGWRDLVATWRLAPGLPAACGRESAAADSLSVRFAQTAFAGGFGFPFGFRPVSLDTVFRGAGGLALHLAALAATTAELALAASGAATAWRRGSPERRAFAAWALAAVLVSLGLYAFKQVKPEPHYFIVTLPPLLLLAGLGAERLPRRLAVWTGAGMVVAGAAVWLAVLLTIRHNGGTAGDYGVTYRAQRAVAERLAADPRGLRILDASLTRDESVGVRYLLALARTASPTNGTPVILADAAIYPGWRPPPNWTEWANPPPGPLRAYARTGVAAEGTGAARGLATP